MNMPIFQQNLSCLLVVILNYRTADLTIDCLASLADEVQSFQKVQVVVTDNDSQDGSVEQIAAAISTHNWSRWVSLLSLNRNGGFAFGNNAAIRMALQSPYPPAYFLLLNPDTVVRSDAISSLINFMTEHPEVGIAGSRLEDPDGTPQDSAFGFPSIFSELDFGLRIGFVSKLLSKWAVVSPISNSNCQTDWLSGASFMVRREVFEAIGLLDEQYFMYFEELDFCLQAYKAGWSCWYVPQSRVVHLVGQSSGFNSKYKATALPPYWFDSRRRYFLKNHGWFYALIADTIWIFGFLFRRLRQIIQRQPIEDPAQLFNNFWRSSVFVKRT